VYFNFSRSSDKQETSHNCGEKIPWIQCAQDSLINIEALFNTRAVALVEVKIRRSELSRDQKLVALGGTWLKVCGPGDQK
jgi:hypothetical protein